MILSILFCRTILSVTFRPLPFFPRTTLPTPLSMIFSHGCYPALVYNKMSIVICWNLTIRRRIINHNFSLGFASLNFSDHQWLWMVQFRANVFPRVFPIKSKGKKVHPNNSIFSKCQLSVGPSSWIPAWQSAVPLITGNYGLDPQLHLNPCFCYPTWWYEQLFFSDIDPCSSNPCQNGGLCQDAEVGWTCTCPPSLTGPFCEQGKLPFDWKSNTL